jgi:outer membrane receptor for ferric coprogen and ferric-rhodotorulic acid
LFGYASEYDLYDKNDLFDAYINGEFSLFGRVHQNVAGINYAQMSYIDTSLYDYTTGNGFPVIQALPEWDGNTPQPTVSDGLTGSDITNKQKAAYFTARFEVLDNLHVITGGRYNDWRVEGSSYSVIQDASDKEFIPYLGAVYQITPELVAYTSYTETFLSQTKLDFNDKILAPMTGESKEIGLKSELFGGLLIGSFAYFDVLQTNLAKLDERTLDLPINLQRYIGVEGISSNGFELEIAGQVYDNLQLSFGLTDFNVSGDEVVADYTPSKLVKLAATYTVPSVEGLSFGVNMNWQDDISRSQGIVGDEFANAGDEIVTKKDAYAVVNLMVAYDITENVKLSFNANNITDEKYINSLYWAQGYYGAPANYSATMSWAL